MYWVGQKVHSGFQCRLIVKPERPFWPTQIAGLGGDGHHVVLSPGTLLRVRGPKQGVGAQSSSDHSSSTHLLFLNCF